MTNAPQWQGEGLVSSDLLVSADSHVTEDADLWYNSLPQSLRDRAPRSRRRTAEEDARFHPGGWDPVERLKEMEQDGVSAEVLFPGSGSSVFVIEDVPLQEACARVYNDWLSDFCRVAPGRLIGVPMLSVYNIESAVSELERCKLAGLKGALLWLVPRADLPFHSEHYNRLWAAAEEMDMPIHLHILSGFGYHNQRTKGPEHLRGNVNLKMAEVSNALFEFIFYGILHRHPRLKLVIAEAEIGWLPFAIQQWDTYYLRFKDTDDLPMDRLPSEYFSQQVFATFVNDEAGCRNLSWWGEDNCMWSSDFPHPVTFWPNSRQLIAKQLGHLNAGSRAKVLHGNARRVYGESLELPHGQAPRPVL
jgi:predicted TIM-barrel fold metal-dependent hydrolase